MFFKIPPQVILMHVFLKTIFSETLISYFFLTPFLFVPSSAEGKGSLIVCPGYIFPCMLCL